VDGSQEAPTSARAKHPPKESQALSPFRFRSLFFLFYISFIPSKALRGGGGETIVSGNTNVVQRPTHTFVVGFLWEFSRFWELVR